MLAVTARQAAEHIRDRTGFTVQELSGCWLWPDRGPGGLGPVRAFYEACYPEPPRAFRIVHTCAGREHGCVNPEHLTILAPGEERAPRPRQLLAGPARGSFAARLGDELAARGGDVRALAIQLGVGQTTIRSWCKATSAPDQDTAAQISHELGWDDAPRRFEVTCVVRRIVTASSAGQAAALAQQELERPDQPGRVRVLQAGLAVGR